MKPSRLGIAPIALGLVATFALAPVVQGQVYRQFNNPPRITPTGEWRYNGNGWSFYPNGNGTNGGQAQPNPNNGQYQQPNNGQYQPPNGYQYQPPSNGQYQPPGNGQYQQPNNGQYQQPNNGQYQPPNGYQYQQPNNGQYQQPNQNVPYYNYTPNGNYNNPPVTYYTQPNVIQPRPVVVYQPSNSKVKYVRQHWVVLFRRCHHEQWREYGCYSICCRAESALDFLRCRGYQATLVRH